MYIKLPKIWESRFSKILRGGCIINSADRLEYRTEHSTVVHHSISHCENKDISRNAAIDG